MTSALHIRSGSPVDDAAQFGRRIRDLTVDGSTQLVKRADLPHLVEAGRDSAAAAVSDVKDRITGRRRRRRTRSLVSAIVAASLAVGLGAWWFIRKGGMSSLRATGFDDEVTGDSYGANVDRAFDAEALARATDDGMGIAATTANTATSYPSASEYAASEAADPLAILTS